ncbi:C4-type zinc ribbon domain-containing protein [Paenibacillus sp. TRM 82003]|uniref:zinc ribbon domain-containing protein n=1 Tax=Kineococcus sp. TRM81007 TaxID=2925831 RepID=UPI001F57D14C|nr:C4-type zinc ribbon domain-containing protein [Kineococcus sp. TRM81007]MCI2240163.1 C4-type zinc ribbon domain-containing protein [Kineococcus sp. TRM81007]MCI3925528.1 C4-type zinc ribbon domain-containing protein [Paenibacillus sp. TRM 82003]
MPKAPAIDQQKLLDLQAVDIRLAQLAHRRATVPEQAELDSLLAERRRVGDVLVAARALVSDAERAVAKSEADVAQVRDRAARNTARLNAGSGSAKDLQGLQHELESLARRQSVLEDAELEAMEKLEQAQFAAAELATTDGELAEQVEDVTRRRDAVLAEVATEERAVLARREAIATGVDAELLRLYEVTRAPRGGVGAALLRGRRCEGCRLELNASDLGAVRAAAADEVVFCEECGRILVRTAESGL